MYGRSVRSSTRVRKSNELTLVSSGECASELVDDIRGLSDHSLPRRPTTQSESQKRRENDLALRAYRASNVNDATRTADEGYLRVRKNW